MSQPTSQLPIGNLLRTWRERRKVSQLALASAAEVSQRHLSFVETGRASPSRGMVLKLAEHLELAHRERNRLLLAAGYAPVYTETRIDDPRLSVVRDAIRRVLAGHEPYPAMVVDRGWHLVEANSGLAVLTEGAPDELLAEPFNVLRYCLHPDGLAPRIVNLGEWRAHVLNRLALYLDRTPDPQLNELYQELLEYPGSDDEPKPEQFDSGFGDVVLPMRLRHEDYELLLFSTVTKFGTARDVTVAELTIESFYPGDETTSRFFHEHG